MKIIKLRPPTTEEESEKRITLGGVNIKKVNIITFLLALLWCCFYAFSFGYGLYNRAKIISLIELIRNYLALFITLILGWYIILFVHELIHLIFYPKATAYLGYNLNKFTLSTCFNGKISKIRLIFINLIPFILLTIIPTYMFFILEFNIVILAIAAINAIISSKDIINVMLILMYMEKNELIIIDNNNIYSKIDILESYETTQNTEDLHQDIESLHPDIEDLHQDTEDLHQDVEDLHQDMEDLHQDVEESHQDVEDLHQDTEDLHQDVEDLHQDVEELHQDVEDLHQDTEEILEILDAENIKSL